MLDFTQFTLYPVIEDFQYKKNRWKNWPPEGVVIHAMGREVNGMPAADFLRSIGLDCDLLLDIDGTWIQMGPLERKFYHAGKAFYNGKRGLNDRIGIEVLIDGVVDYSDLLNRMGSMDHPPYTNEQYDSLSEGLSGMMKYWEWNWSDHIHGHEDVQHAEVVLDPKDIKYDPGDAFDWIRLKNMVNAKHLTDEF